ncbi:MAG: hypothetical protein ACR2PX_25755 [Endozoicomonas sp.]|uniref:hypothetical protein n=1 Tax=Endozoicomonas sp. TaxID=1892382 RepID=UPI003D9B4112
MTTHGGSRPGSGRPQGGISQARRLITDAIQNGLAQAGRKKYPDRVDQVDVETAAIQTGAMIVDDMIQAGQGNDVMKLWAAVAMKESDNEKAGSRNTLAEALSRLPAARQVSDVSRLSQPMSEDLYSEGSATHIECGALAGCATLRLCSGGFRSAPLTWPYITLAAVFCKRNLPQIRPRRGSGAICLLENIEL